MRRRFEIVRRAYASAQPYLQCVDVDVTDKDTTVALELERLNSMEILLDVERKPVKLPICYERSCLQKKCGACAMVICGLPRLACDTKLVDLPDTIRLEPLRKFPVVADLVVDRSTMRQNLCDLGCWLGDSARMSESGTHIAYDAGRCLQCGCCLEVCPNFAIGTTFAGPSATTDLSRLIAIAPNMQEHELEHSYLKHIYAGCGKSLACMDVCPANIAIDRLLVRSNVAAIWRHLWRWGRKDP